jgi:hypothetical protein
MPKTFALAPGQYKVAVADYDGAMFSRWQDGATERSRIINVTAGDASLTAYYNISALSVRGYTPLAFPGEGGGGPGHVTVKAVDAGTGEPLHMWAVIEARNVPGQANATLLVVRVHDYRDLTFERWEDGGTNSTRALTGSAAGGGPAEMVAYYRLDPALGPQTPVISADTQLGALEVKEGGTVVVMPGVSVTAEHVLNRGNLTNYGTISTGFLRDMVNDGGVIENYGRLSNSQGDIYNVNGGVINIKAGGSLEHARQSSAVPGTIVNDATSAIDNYGSMTVSLYGGGGATVQNDGTMYRECGGSYSIPFLSGNAVIDRCPAAQPPSP